MWRSVLIGLPIALAVVAGCATAQSSSPGAAPAAAGAAGSSAPPSSASSTTAAALPDYEATPADFKNLHDMTPIRGFFLDSLNGHLADAIAVANAPDGGVYPVGTVIQLIPQEAMVKRAPGFAPDLGDWEFFQLNVSPTGTDIKQRGTGNIKNLTGQPCGVCHMKSDIRFDFVCEKTHKCDPLPLSDEFFKNLQNTDPRPRQATS